MLLILNLQQKKKYPQDNKIKKIPNYWINNEYILYPCDIDYSI